MGKEQRDTFVGLPFRTEWPLNWDDNHGMWYTGRPVIGLILSTPQVPFKIPHIPTNRDHELLPHYVVKGGRPRGEVLGTLGSHAEY